MTSAQLGYLAMIFIIVAVTAFVVMRALTPRITKTRLKNLTAENVVQQQKISGQWQQSIVKLTEPLAKLALPSEGWENSLLRTRFLYAGYRGKSVPMIYFSAKTGLALAFPGIFLLYTSIAHLSLGANTIMMAVLGLAAAGYYLPNMVLSRMVMMRQRELFESFPDAIDLITVCIEAGLGLNAALLRVGEEMRLRSKALADEIYLVNLELRAGRSRDMALRNLALRTGVEEIASLVAILIQADRFGTSIATSLRNYSDTLRTIRQLRAEEMAAKIALKLLFPLILFIFPSLLLVLLGPAFISIVRALSTINNQ